MYNVCLQLQKPAGGGSGERFLFLGDETRSNCSLALSGCALLGPMLPRDEARPVGYTNPVLFFIMSTASMQPTCTTLKGAGLSYVRPRN